MPQTAAAVAATVWRLVQPVGVQLSVVAQPLRNTPRTIRLSNFCLFTNFSSLQLIPTFLQLGAIWFQKLLTYSKALFSYCAAPCVSRWRFSINSLKCSRGVLQN